ncbi:MAG TPA: hypothetical protein VE913_06955, partial [Longimicrobium sp.]|nr:hypothetical protein [Longimicrobium sp.]
MEQTYFRRGFGRKKEIEPLIRSEYQSGLVERIRERGYEDRSGTRSGSAARSPSCGRSLGGSTSAPSGCVGGSA